jgi:hypothetical protein
MKKVILLMSAILFVSAFVSAQPRIVEKKIEKPQPAALAPVSFKAKYEGGLFGFSKKEEGTLKFDDANFRLVFFDKNDKERFGIPYKALIVIYPNTESVQSGTGKVVQNVPLMGAGIAGQFIKKKVRYLVISFDDPDMDAKGTTSFRLESAELLELVVQTLGTKAEMQPRGDAYYRPKKQTPSGN